jgi:hypothetical protein
LKKNNDDRWDEQITQQLPAHFKALLVNIFNTTNKIEEELKLQENRHAELVKKMVNKLYSKRSH